MPKRIATTARKRPGSGVGRRGQDRLRGALPHGGAMSFERGTGYRGSGRGAATRDPRWRPANRAGGDGAGVAECSNARCRRQALVYLPGGWARLRGDGAHGSEPLALSEAVRDEVDRSAGPGPVGHRGRGVRAVADAKPGPREIGAVALAPPRRSRGAEYGQVRRLTGRCGLVAVVGRSMMVGRSREHDAPGGAVRLQTPRGTAVLPRAKDADGKGRLVGHAPAVPTRRAARIAPGVRRMERATR